MCREREMPAAAADADTGGNTSGGPAQSAQYLDDFTESIAELPTDLNKNLSLMGELDSRATEAFDELKERAAKCMRRAKGGSAEEIKKQVWEQLPKNTPNASALRRRR